MGALHNRLMDTLGALTHPTLSEAAVAKYVSDLRLLLEEWTGALASMQAGEKGDATRHLQAAFSQAALSDSSAIGSKPPSGPRVVRLHEIER